MEPQTLPEAESSGGGVAATRSTFNNHKVIMVGAPWCEGQNLEGADLAPYAMRVAGLADAVETLGLTFVDHGDLDFRSVVNDPNHPLAEHHYSTKLYREWLAAGTASNFSTWMQARSPSPAIRRKRSYEAALCALARTDVNVVNAELMGGGLEVVYDAVRRALAPPPALSPFVLTVGGDHSIASGTISAMLGRHPSLGVIWVDAHADANTPRSSPSGHYHGMPAAHLLGWFEKEGELGKGVPAGSLKGFDWFPSGGCLAENKLAYIGLRDVDPEEGRMLRSSGVRVFTMRDVDKHGIAKCIEMAIEAVGPSADCPLHLSLDIDSVDPHFAPGTGTAARGGLTYREIHYICEECALTKRLVSMDVVEVNPGLDPPPPVVAEGAPEGGGDAAVLHGDHPRHQARQPDGSARD